MESANSNLCTEVCKDCCAAACIQKQMKNTGKIFLISFNITNPFATAWFAILNVFAGDSLHSHPTIFISLVP